MERDLQLLLARFSNDSSATWSVSWKNLGFDTEIGLEFDVECLCRFCGSLELFSDFFFWAKLTLGSYILNGLKVIMQSLDADLYAAKELGFLTILGELVV